MERKKKVTGSYTEVNSKVEDVNSESSNTVCNAPSKQYSYLITLFLFIVVDQ